jgi:hypothetical protein
MKKSFHYRRSSNGLWPHTNRLIGSLTYIIFHSFVFWISYKIWGIQMFDEVWFYLMHVVSFFSVKLFLIFIGVWNH